MSLQPTLARKVKLQTVIAIAVAGGMVLVSLLAAAWVYQLSQSQARMESEVAALALPTLQPVDEQVYGPAWFGDSLELEKRYLVPGTAPATDTDVRVARELTSHDWQRTGGPYSIVGGATPQYESRFRKWISGHCHEITVTTSDIAGSHNDATPTNGELRLRISGDCAGAAE